MLTEFLLANSGLPGPRADRAAALAFLRPYASHASWRVREAVAAYSGPGRTAFERLPEHRGKHVAWIVRENLKKDRLAKMDAAWVASLASRLG